MENELDPEEVFEMCTLLPKYKIRVMAHLEDKEGNILTIKEVAVGLVKYIDEQMTSGQINPVNSQLFPACGQFMTSLVPRFIGLELSSFMFQAPSFREALLFLSLGSILFTRYIDQHELKIVTTQEDLTDEQIESFQERSRRAEEALRSAVTKAFNITDEDD